MLQAIIRQDGKYERLRLSDRLHDGFIEVERDGEDILLKSNKSVIEVYVPEPTIAEKKNAIIKQMNALDRKSIRPLRKGETERVAEIEEEIETLRTQLAKLEV